MQTDRKSGARFRRQRRAKLGCSEKFVLLCRNAGLHRVMQRCPPPVTPFFLHRGARSIVPGMHIEAELAPDQVRQFARPDGFAGAHLSLEKGAKTLALDLVWSPRPAFPGHQADDACTLEVGLGLIEGWSKVTPYSSDTWVTDILSTDTRRSIS